MPSLRRAADLTAAVLGAPVFAHATMPARELCANAAAGERRSATRSCGAGVGLHVTIMGGVPAGSAPLFITDARQDPGPGAVSTATAVIVAVEAGAAALALLPVASGAGQSLGALCVLGTQPREWTAQERRALEAVAASLAVEHDLRRELERSRGLGTELRRHVLHDPLTGLPNRVLLLERLTHAATRARRHKDFRFAVLALDLDRFSIVNGSLGREPGDDLLVSVARRLESCVRSEDMVARVGSDEFTILLESLSDDADAGRVAERIQCSLAEPVDVGGHEVFTSASIGLTLSSSGVESAAAMLQNADVALARAKRAGRARYEMFDPAMHARAVRRLKAETELHRAIERGEFEVYYQPMVTLATGRITELEALIRWRHPERGVVPPLEFIPLAEETGLIVPIGNWVLTEACRQLREWQRRFERTEPLSMSVNLSVRELAEPGLTTRVAAAVAESGIDPHTLKLEITESFAIDDAERTRTMLDALRGLGVRIYLDDFGTGYSSLGYLHRLPLDAIKIDRTFVTRMDTGAAHLQLVNTVRTLAHNIGVAAVAEGVETAAQLDTLRAMGCEYAQGYLFSKPVPASDVERLLADDPRW